MQKQQTGQKQVPEDFKQMVADAITKAPSQTEYLKAVAKQEELKGKLDALCREKEEILSRIRSKQEAGGKDRVEQLAEQLLRGEPAKPDPRFMDRLGEIRDQVIILEAAIDMQLRKVQEWNRKRSEEVGEALRSTHRRLVHLMSNALKSLSDAAKNENDFREAILETDIYFSHTGMHPLPFSEDIRLDLSYSRAILWMKEAEENGYIVAEHQAARNGEGWIETTARKEAAEGGRQERGRVTLPVTGFGYRP